MSYLVSYVNYCRDTGCDVENRIFDNLRDARTFMLGSVCLETGVNDPEAVYTIVPNENNDNGYQSNIMNGERIVGQIGSNEAWMYDDELGWTFSAYWKVQEIAGSVIKDVKLKNLR